VEGKQKLLQTKITKPKNLGKPYSNIMPTWRDTACKSKLASVI